MLKALVSLLLLCNLVGCNHDIGIFRSNRRVPPYRIGFKNATTEMLKGVRFDWDGGTESYNDQAGSLGVGSTKQADSEPDPIPERVTVSWETLGKEHEKVVAVASQIKDIGHFAGTIWFRFTRDGVEVVPITDDDFFNHDKDP